MNANTPTAVLDRVNLPADCRQFSLEELQQLADDLRRETVDCVAETGGHLGAGLGVVELTVALHHVFDTPRDRLIWDVGHQAYPHKILTGRRGEIRTIRQGGGLSGFCKREESEYDAFGAGHSSTSISAALGMAVARDLAGQQHEVIAVIGDGAMSAGMAYEAMNNAGALGTRLIVILNDNDMSIAPPTGAMSAYLSRLISSQSYRGLRHAAKSVASRFPAPLLRAARSAEKAVKGLAVGGTLFEQLGFYYVGPVDGHNLEHLLPVLKNIRDDRDSGPVLVHVVTRKGHGYAPAEIAKDKYHGVAKFDVKTGAQAKPVEAVASYTDCFAEALIAASRADSKIVAITAAMPSGTGLDRFASEFPDRCFDVGIAEQHAVTFAAGLAAEGYRPFCAIYSTFLQRAYDQVVHDVAIQNLPVRFAIDRAGLVGADGPTHAGAFDLAYLSNLPNFTVMAPADGAELAAMVTFAAAHDRGPIALRYPRGNATGTTGDTAEPLSLGRGRVLREGTQVALLSIGTCLADGLEAAQILVGEGISVTVADARFAKPLDAEMLAGLISHHRLLVTIEEGASGGFGAQVQQLAHSRGWLDDGRCRVRSLTLPDRFQPHDTQPRMRAEAGLSAAQIAATVRGLMADAAADRTRSHAA